MKSLKVRLELNNKQATMASKHAGCARHAYSWGVSVCQKAFEAKEKIPSAIDLHKKLVSEVKTVYPWYYQSSKCAPPTSIKKPTNIIHQFSQKAKKKWL